MLCARTLLTPPDSPGPVSTTTTMTATTATVDAVAANLWDDCPRELCLRTAHPFLTHALRQEECSVLSLAADARHIFSGSQGKDIYVWDRETMQLETTLHGHSGSVLMLEVSEEKGWLFSSSSDSTLRIWSTTLLSLLYVINPHGETDAGDIFSLTFSPDINTLFFGCQNTSLQWLDLSHPERASINSGRPDIQGSTNSPRKFHKFFDSQPRGSPSQNNLRNTHGPTSHHGQPSSYGSSVGESMGELGLELELPRNRSSSSLGLGGSSHSFRSSISSALSGPPLKLPVAQTLQVPPSNVIDSAHYGYIYCMNLVPSLSSSDIPTPFGDFKPDTEYFGNDALIDGEVQLVTGSGDEDVKLWSIRPYRSPVVAGISGNHASLSDTARPPELLHTFLVPGGTGGAVLTVMIRNGCIYAGCQDGYVHIWDLETRTLVRSIVTKENVDVLSLSLLDNDLYTCLSDGEIKRWSGSFACTATWKAHAGIVLSSIIVPSSPASPGSKHVQDSDQSWSLITGASDNHIKLWTIERPEDPTKKSRRPAALPARTPLVTGRFPILASFTDAVIEGDDVESSIFVSRGGITNDAMVFALTDFVSIPSVTNSEPHREYCRQAAIWLQRSLSKLGAEAYLLPSKVEGKNPLVLGTFHGSAARARKPRVLFYGHYDVISAPNHSTWSNPPFSLTGVNGYLYGRGVTDNKGPILAVACAAADLLARHALDVDVVFLIEGEEEAGSGGFVESVRANKDRIGHIDAILVSNSYWIDDETPCITFGLRGVLQATVEISSGTQDLHSGVEGGAWTEPMMDMIKLLATLSDKDSKILIPTFYDTVRSQDPHETDSYDALSKLTGKPASSIASRWREPSLTVHNVSVSGANNPTVIPSTVKAQVSLRIVPDQNLNEIASGLKRHLATAFENLNSPNSLHATIDRAADWWLGQLDDHWFRALEKSVREEWGVQPLRIREGGSIPSVPYLEKEFGCHALHLPMGQSSDQAHLQNERISLNNLYKGRSVVERFFRSLSSSNFE